MKAISLPNPDARLGAPENWDETKQGVCHTLDVMLLDGAMVSGWMPSPDELAKLNDGEPLFLHVVGSSHPPVSITVGW